MRFFLDHDVPAEVARVLRNEGHEAVELRDALSTKSTDEQVFDHARTLGMITVTCNRDDFLALAARYPRHPGLIVLIRRRTRQAECAHLLTLLTRAGEVGLAGNINFA